jgi:hypothetical protein
MHYFHSVVCHVRMFLTIYQGVSYYEVYAALQQLISFIDTVLLGRWYLYLSFLYELGRICNFYDSIGVSIKFSFTSAFHMRT